jgi:hypothetical protein
VHIRLVTGVENDGVVRGIEDPMDGHRQLYDPEVRAQMTAGLGNLSDEELPDLGGEQNELFLRKSVQIPGPVDTL